MVNELALAAGCQAGPMDASVSARQGSFTLRGTCGRVLLVAALVAGADVSRAAAQACDAAPVLVRNTNVWTRDSIVAGQDVLFRSGRLAVIEPANSHRYPRVRTIDGAGHTLLPGLVDSHLHLSIPGGVPADKPPTYAEEIAGRQLLRSGVTSGRLHLATVDEAVRLKARSADACAPMPRLQVGGPGLSGAADKDVGNFQGAKSPDDARTKMARVREAGLDWVAVHDAERFPADVLTAIAAAARQAGIRLMASGGTPREITAALSIGPDTLDYIDRTAEPLYAAPILDLIRGRTDLVLVPTLGVPYRTGEYLRQPADLERADNYEFLDAAGRAFVAANAVKALAGADATRVQRTLSLLPGKFQQLRQLGLPMALGSDAGSPLHFQAGAIWWELEAWRALGASHRDALIAATENGARVLRDDSVGRLRAGGRADFVLYRGNVEEGPFALARVLAVGKSGVLYVTDGQWIAPKDGSRN